MVRALGIDVGIASVGYSLVELDEENFNGKFLDLGVRIFTAAENPKSGASLALPRREARGARRRIARRAARLYNIKKLLTEKGVITKEEIERTYNSSDHLQDVWSLRKEALDRPLNNKEFYRILMHIAKRRGFKSIRKAKEAKKEGQLLQSIKENKELFAASENYRTIGEMYAVKYSGGEAKRNKAGKYNKSIPRDLLQEEIEIIFEAQRKFNVEMANLDIEQQYKDIAFSQRPLKTIEIDADCTFEPKEKRAPKCAYTSEKFIALNKLVNLRLIDEQGDTRFLSEDEINKAIELAHKIKKVTYKQLREELEIKDDTKFIGLKYPEEATLIEFKNYHEIKSVIEKTKGKKYFETIKNNKDFFNKIAYILTCEKTDEAIEKKLKEAGYIPEIIDGIKELSMNKTAHLSIKAMDKLIPYMMKGYKYSEACKAVGYEIKENSGKKQAFLPVLAPKEMTTNPVVNRAVSQVRKVINALIRKHGAFDVVIIEMARDLSKSLTERKQIEKMQGEFQEEKEKARKRCEENGVDPDSSNNLLKYRLWEEQGGWCVYSGKKIEIERLAEQGYADVDHIIPYSRSYDDSLNNKVLCLTSENRQKGSKIPYEYIGENKWYDFTQRIKSYNLRAAKYNRLIKKEYCKQEGFKSRNLNDTRYIAKFIKDYIKENLDFGNNLEVRTINGSLTAFLRHQWGFIKTRENDKHHALDAAIISCSTERMVKFLSTISAKLENYDYTKDTKPRFRRPWNTFKNDLEIKMNELFVSRAERKSIKGELHEETIRSDKHIKDGGYTTLKTPLESINLKTLENMYDKERNYKIYNLLKERLEQNNNDPKQAFIEPVYMPLSKEKAAQNQKPHRINSIKIKNTSISGILVRGGFANNSSIARTDVFTKKNKKGKNEYFLVPIYVSNFGNKLPNKAIVKGKKEEDWIEMTDEYTFCFSLFPNTLIGINKTGKPEDEFIGYYVKCNRANGAIIIDYTDRPKEKTFGTKTLAYIKKYQVGILGDYHEVKKEKRLDIKRKQG